MADNLDPSDVTLLGIENPSSLCGVAVDMYCALLGGLAGDYALVFGAHGGVYLSGKVLRTLGVRRLKDRFTERFVSKDKMNSEVRDIPVYLVHRDHPGLLGAAVWLLQETGTENLPWKVVA